MSDKIKLSVSLKSAIMGDKESFIAICALHYKSIYRFIYQLHPDVKHSSEETISVFMYAWENLGKYPRDKEMLEWLKEISIIMSIYHLKAEREMAKENIEEGHKYDINFSKLEKAVLEIPDNQRTALFLYNVSGYPISKISRLCGSVKPYEIVDHLSSALKKISKRSDLETLKDMNEENFRILINCEENGDISSSNFNDNTLMEYGQLNTKLSELFMDVAVPEDLLEKIEKRLNESDIAPELVSKNKNKNTKRNKIKEKTEKTTREALKRALSQDDSIKEYKRTELLTNTKKASVGLIIVSIILGIVFGINYMLSINTPWPVLAEDGKSAVNELNEGDSINNKTEYEITIPENGSFKLFENSSLSLIKGFEGDNIIKLDEGGLDYKSFKSIHDITEFAEEPSLTIKLPYGILKTEVCELTIDLSDLSSINISEGWCEVIYNDKSIFLGTGYAFYTENKLLVPFRKNSDLLAGNEGNIFGADLLLNNIGRCEEGDALTLWHLLSIVDLSKRQIIINKLQELFPIFIDNNFAESILYLKEEELNILLELIKITTVYE